MTIMMATAESPRRLLVATFVFLYYLSATIFVSRNSTFFVQLYLLASGQLANLHIVTVGLSVNTCVLFQLDEHRLSSSLSRTE